jgi:hypothetical protein
MLSGKILYKMMKDIKPPFDEETARSKVKAAQDA